MLLFDGMNTKKLEEMNVLNFVDTNVARSMNVLFFIDSSVEPVSLEEITNEIGSVKRTVHTLLELLKAEVNNCGFSLEEDKNRNYYLVSKERDREVDLNIYLLKYGENSLFFLMIKEMFERGFINICNFCSEYYISHPTFSRGKTKLTKILKLCYLDFTIQKDYKIIGNEYRQRIFYYKFFEGFYNTLRWPFEKKVKKEIVDLCLFSRAIFLKKMSREKQHKIYYMLAIMRNRILKGHEVKKINYSFENHSLYGDIYNFIKQFFERWSSQDDTRIKQETTFFFCFLYTENLLSSRNEKFENLISGAIDNQHMFYLNSLWINMFTIFFECTLTEEQKINWLQELTNIHLMLEFIYYDRELFMKKKYQNESLNFDENIYKKTEYFVSHLLTNKFYFNYKEKNLKNISITTITNHYYYYIYKFLISEKENDFVTLFVSHSIEIIEKQILEKKLKLLFGEKLKICQTLGKDVELVVTSRNVDIFKAKSVVVYSVSDPRDFKKIVTTVERMLYSKAFDIS